jgi:hypothetical protein
MISANSARRLLINSGKVLPFALCFILSISYSETLVAIITEDFLEYEGYVVLNTPISFRIAKVFRYDWLMMVLVFVISFAIEACKWNMYASMYLAVHLLEKHYFTFEMEMGSVALVAGLNLIIAVFFVYKGCCIFIKKC